MPAGCGTTRVDHPFFGWGYLGTLRDVVIATGAALDAGAVARARRAATGQGLDDLIEQYIVHAARKTT